jgi:TonB family protein
MSSAANRNTETTTQKVISSQLATQEVQKSQPDPKVGAESAKPSYQQNFVTQAAENKVKHDVQAQQSSQILTDKFLNLEQPTEHAQSRSGGVKTAATQQELTRAPENQVERSEPVQVSSVDVLSFGKFAYDDRELKQQNRIVELRLRINESGQPTEIELKQSSGIASLDERVLQAARQSKFKPYKINGHAVAVVVDFPVQLKLSRSR